MMIRLAAAVLAASPIAAAADELSGEDLIAVLRDGGHVLYIRHAQTEADYADQVTADPADCSTQRTLSEAGWQQARTIGQAIDRLEIPVGDVLSSEYCRAWQTASLAFDRYSKDAALNFEPAEDYTDAQVAAMRDRVKPIIQGWDDAARNLVIVGHDDPFEAVTGIYPEPQGVTYVLKPGGTNGEISVLGHIGPDDWTGLTGNGGSE